jgi:hypothetical protein
MMAPPDEIEFIDRRIVAPNGRAYIQRYVPGDGPMIFIGAGPIWPDRPRASFRLESTRDAKSGEEVTDLAVLWERR